MRNLTKQNLIKYAADKGLTIYNAVDEWDARCFGLRLKANSQIVYWFKESVLDINELYFSHVYNRNTGVISKEYKYIRSALNFEVKVYKH